MNFSNLFFEKYEEAEAAQKLQLLRKSKSVLCILLEQNPYFWINVHRGGGWLQSVLPRVLKEEVTTQVGTKERNKSFARMYMICVLPTASF